MLIEHDPTQSLGDSAGPGTGDYPHSSAPSAEGAIEEVRTGHCVAETGTAQTTNPDGSPGTDDWMIGFAPANNPKIAVGVVVRYQAQSYSGVLVAGPIMNTMLTAALQLVDERLRVRGPDLAGTLMPSAWAWTTSW